MTARPVGRRAPPAQPLADWTPSERLASAIVRDWYSSSLRVKLVQAVAEGRADEGRAIELHRLLTGLVGLEQQLGADVDGLVRAGRRAAR